nr:CAZy families GH18 protein [uncultured Bacteroides sp.]
MIDMNKHYIYISLISLLTFILNACDTDVEPEVIQKENSYNEEYYQSLREYKKTDHAICFGWYAGYTSEASPSSGLHFTGLPDSWMLLVVSSIPSNNPSLRGD